MWLILLVFIILLGIVGALSCIKNGKIEPISDEYNADDFEIIEIGE